MRDSYKVTVIEPIQIENSKISFNKTGDNIKVKKKSREYIGIIFALISSLTFSLGSLIVKTLTSRGFHPFSIASWRFLGILTTYVPILLFYVLRSNDNVLKPIWPEGWREKLKMWLMLLGRWISGSSAIVLQFISLQYLILSDSLVITFSTPVFVTLFAPLILREKCSIIPILLAVLTLLGVGIMLRPPIITGEQSFDSGTLIGAGFAFLSMIVTGISFILMQKLRQVHYSVMLSFFGLWGTFESLSLSYSFNGEVRWPIEMSSIFLGISVVILAILAQTFLTLALKFTPASPVSLIRTLDVVFGVIWQGIFTGVSLDAISWSGLIIVMFGVIVAICREWLLKLPKDHSMRNLFSFILK